MIINPFACPVDASGREQVIHGSSDFPIACYYNDLVAFPVLLHWHEELEAGIVIEGTAIISIGSEKHLLKAGEGIFINTGVLHDAYPAEGGSCIIHSMVFHPRLVGGNGDSVFYRRYLRPLLEDPALEWLFLSREDNGASRALEGITAAWNACRAEEPGYEFSVRSALSDLVSQVYLLHSPKNHGLSTKSQRDSRRIKQMLTYIHENYGSVLSIRSIAGSALISESECLRCFRTAIGSTPIQYVRQHRLRQAAMQLLSTPDKISDIAERCGFQDMSYFTKSFREFKDCSPSEYRLRKAARE